MKKTHDITLKSAHIKKLFDENVRRWHALTTIRVRVVHDSGKTCMQYKWPSIPISNTYTSPGLPKKTHSRRGKHPPLLSVKITVQSPFRCHISNNVACNEPILEFLATSFHKFLNSKKESVGIPINRRYNDLPSNNWGRICQARLKGYKCSPHLRVPGGFFLRTIKVYPLKLIRWIRHSTHLIRCITYPEISLGTISKLMCIESKRHILMKCSTDPFPIHFNFLQRRHVSA